MTLSPQIQTFVEELQAFSNNRIHYPQEVGQLIGLAQPGMMDVFGDTIFYAKFVTKTHEVLRRIGPAGEGSAQLSAEYASNLEKTTTLLRTIVKEAPEDVKHHFSQTFFLLDQESVGRLLSFLSDLSWVKNWEVDGRPLLFQPAGSQRAPAETSPAGKDPDNEDLPRRIFLSAAMTAVLLLVFLLVEPPIAVFSWLLLLAIAGLLSYIITATSRLKKTFHSN